MAAPTSVRARLQINILIEPDAQIEYVDVLFLIEKIIKMLVLFYTACSAI